jgi:hypothetical protein
MLCFHRLHCVICSAIPSSMTPRVVALAPLSEIIATVAYRRQNAGVVLAFATLVATFWKTVAYMSSDWLAGFPNTKHNDNFTFLTLYFLPSFVWLLVPALAIVRLFSQLAAEGKDKKQ